MASGSLWLAVLVALTCIGDKILCDKVCDRGWTYSELDHSCLRFSQTDRKTFGDARRVCQKLGGDLVSVRNEEKNEYLRRLALGYSYTTIFWIGVQDKKQTREFTHLDGSGLEFQAWSGGKPRYFSKNNDQSCVEVYIPTRGKTVWWNDKCSATRKYICQKDAEGHNPSLKSSSSNSKSEGSRCPNDWFYYEDCKSCLKNYRLPSDFKTFQEARTVCQENGADIVRVKDLKKDKFILDMDWSYVNLVTFWVKEEKDLAKDFNPWSPKLRGKRAAGLCVLSQDTPSLYLHSMWRYEPCDKLDYFVCEKPAQ